MLHRHFKLLFVLLMALLVISCSNNAPQENISTEPSPATLESDAIDNSIDPIDNTSDGEDSVQDTTVIHIKAYQFGYTPEIVYLKRNEPVQLVLSSEDVAHGFLIKELGINETVNPGEDVSVEITPAETGEFEILCNVFCGSGHKDMMGKIIVTD